MIWILPLLAGLLCAALCKMFVCAPWAAWAKDVPNARSLHTKIVPRTGGLGIWIGVAFTLALAIAPRWITPDWTLVWICAIGACLASVSFLDDLRGIPIVPRLLAQLAAGAASLAVAGVLTWSLSTVGLILAIVWMTNLYNFMDGSDGLAGGMAVFGFAAYAIAAAWGGADALCFISLTIACGAAGFLTQNFPPARLFMGDVGSTGLGFFAATLGFYGYRHALWPVWFPLLVFSPFIVDASLTLARRARQGEKVWQAHNQHYYQRLVRMGWGHRRTAYAQYLLMSATGGSALLGLQYPFWSAALLLIWSVVFLVLMRRIDALWAARSPQ